MAETYKKSSSRDTFESLIVTVILAVFGTTFVLQAFKIPTVSMENTLLVGDHLLVNKFAFAPHRSAFGHLLAYRTIHRGDIVVFKYPSSDSQSEPGEHFVKRVVGVPGDRIRIVHRQVFVNDQPVAEPFVQHSIPADQPYPGDDFPPSESLYLGSATVSWATEIHNYIRDGQLFVPPSRYFVMGDNREKSWDSRFWGFVPRELISGRPLLIYWSFETSGDEYKHNSLGDRASQISDLILHFFGKTHWRRSLKFVR